MATRLLSVGYVQQLVQNEVCALPSSRCFMYTDTATPANFEQSDTVAFTSFVAVPLAAGQQIEIGGGFIRFTGAAGANIMLKKA